MCGFLLIARSGIGEDTVMAYTVLKLVAVLGGEGMWKWGGGEVCHRL